MYERMLEKQNKPTIEAMKAYCGEASSLFTILHSWLMQYSDITYDIDFLIEIIMDGELHFGKRTS